jgi:DNA-binding NarL/FixJ family response regulator
MIYRSNRRIGSLRDNLQQQAKVSKGYVGVVFKLYSSYIKRFDAFRMKIYSTLKKGNLDQALDLASPSKDLISNERKNLFQHFDTAFVDIFPDYIEVVNSYLKPEMRITPKRTEILNTELRILALIKLGIEDNGEIAEMLHCTVKTVMNQRAVFRSRLAVPEKVFNKAISEL